MTTFPNLIPLAMPPNPVLSPEMVTIGPSIPAIDRIKLFGHEQWEEFVLEWADSKRMEYVKVDRCGGAGDMGRDLIGTVTEDPIVWDNFQCKHYAESLMPIDIWLEIGKLAYYTMIGSYTYPRRYFFVAPRGVGTKLSNLLRNPAALKKGLLENWGKYCRLGITATMAVELDDKLKAYIDSLDFSIFSGISPLVIIDGHAQTRWHLARFGGGLPPRPDIACPAFDPTEAPAPFMMRLFDAYGDHLKRNVAGVHDLTDEESLLEHFHDSRTEFFSAESLRVFSRDTLPPREFEKLQKEIHAGIRDEIRATHADGYARLLAVVKVARALQLMGHVLHARMSVRDYGGICHQLANEGVVRWTK